MTTREQYEEWFIKTFDSRPFPSSSSAPAFDFCWAGFQAGAASRDAEISDLKELIRLIFESTPPYREDGSYVFTDAVIDKWKELRQ